MTICDKPTYYLGKEYDSWRYTSHEHPKSASSKLTDMLLTKVRMSFLEKTIFLQDLTQAHPWAANTHETNEIIRILLEEGCPTAPQAGGHPSKNDPKTLEVLQRWIFEE